MKRQSFLKGALILMAAGLINRIIGFVLRMILVRIVGDEGLGLFQMVFPLFITLLLLCTAGFPVAISKLIPEKLALDDKKGCYRLLRITLISTGLMSIVIALVLFFSSELIAATIYNDERIHLILRAVVPALIFSPVAASFRGFFQGMQTMIPTAVSQILEQISRAIATIILINMVSYLSLQYQAASIAFGLSLGELSGLIVLIIFFISYYYIDRRKELRYKTDQIKKSDRIEKKTFGYSFKAIAALGIPITLGRLVNSLMMSGEAILIPRRLVLSGLSVSEATSLYGQLSGMAEQLIFLPTVITIALTTSLIPNISDANARKNLHKIRNNYQDVMRITCYLGFPVTVIFFKMGNRLCQLIFGYGEAGQILAILAFSATFIYYLQVSSGMLNGLGKPQLPLFNLTVGSAVKLVGIFFLTSNPEMGIQGAAISISLGYALAALLNFLSIGKRIGFRLDISQCFLKPLLASGLIYLLYPYLAGLPFPAILPSGQRWQTIILLFFMIMIYLFMMIFTGAVTSADIKRFKHH